ncbi:MAG: UDP-glucose--hexose-1-phosphate uridylyltransferase [Candidatus Marinimicrobia bacterium]|jgi:UDPglucose--hexose-1-phosphate uridylyltransferase|nr:UDP-glucose--hexose-1-phosphate uridylyltransferase [Candidatus Neomarinimicrobiota bacterium]MBT4361159.1 UDP-glucose--hexose-1-phosphate uridylyltransferase [Candidatus Neomarinimicrobiota bacterium]MBT4715197.1 UDP-glucose--hexose-1-phosphate uridylyltransferase [Candidatus Neomarinimicrobiota bacterium]MBT4947371.1 UDP-glucose--hexose-1-phosphate uridylyltransferase [Candidatus Neomarinimicrobiota bacterium]MBT5271440.1 UDP-glucose--hexose-1-phosphate uridylyltransferase [Candidatus Neom
MIRPGDTPHRRYNPLTGEWVLVSAHRTERPWQGLEEGPERLKPLEHDPNCYLCPGGKRAIGDINPLYDDTFVFTNDYPALLTESMSSPNQPGNEFFRWQDTQGTSRVICYSPRHDLTLPQLPLEQVKQVVLTWRDQEKALSEKYKYVQIFENKGAQMGASNPHPHGQIWAGNFIPTLIEKEDLHQRQYFAQKGETLLLAYMKQETALAERVVVQNEGWVALVPFWAVWPFETIIIPKIAVRHMSELSDDLAHDLADLLKKLLTKYDHLFNVSFPYSMGWHSAPNTGSNTDHWTLHAHIYPPLLRSASVRKFMVGYELMAEAQRDLTAENAAARLAELPETYSI